MAGYGPTNALSNTTYGGRSAYKYATDLPPLQSSPASIPHKQPEATLVVCSKSIHCLQTLVVFHYTTFFVHPPLPYLISKVSSFSIPPNPSIKMKTSFMSCAVLLLSASSVVSAASQSELCPVLHLLPTRNCTNMSTVVLTKKLPPRQPVKASMDARAMNQYDAIFHAAPLFQDLSHVAPWNLENFAAFAPSR